MLVMKAITFGLQQLKEDVELCASPRRLMLQDRKPETCTLSGWSTLLLGQGAWRRL